MSTVISTMESGDRTENMDTECTSIRILERSMRDSGEMGLKKGRESSFSATGTIMKESSEKERKMGMERYSTKMGLSSEGIGREIKPLGSVR